MKLQAVTIEELFKNSGKWEADLRGMDKIIVKNRPDLKREYFDGMSISMIGYGVQPYKYASGREGEWPLIALAPQKNYMSLYICICVDGKYLPETYADRLGKVKCGKSCIRFTKLENLNLEVVKEMLGKV